jgi:hypothetical protein
MQEEFNPSQISKVIDQALVYQCACPAQVCKTIFELRELYDYQQNCANDTANDKLVHDTIAKAAEEAHRIYGGVPKRDSRYRRVGYGQS